MMKDNSIEKKLTTFFFLFLYLLFFNSDFPDLANTTLDPPTQTTFCVDEVPNGSKQDPQYKVLKAFFFARIASVIS